jgi:hypothetical protein
VDIAREQINELGEQTPLGHNEIEKDMESRMNVVSFLRL